MQVNTTALLPEEQRWHPCEHCGAIPLTHVDEHCAQMRGLARHLRDGLVPVYFYSLQTVFEDFGIESFTHNDTEVVSSGDLLSYFTGELHGWLRERYAGRAASFANKNALRATRWQCDAHDFARVSYIRTAMNAVRMILRDVQDGISLGVSLKKRDHGRNAALIKLYAGYPQRSHLRLAAYDATEAKGPMRGEFVLTDVRPVRRNAYALTPTEYGREAGWKVYGVTAVWSHYAGCYALVDASAVKEEAPSYQQLMLYPNILNLNAVRLGYSSVGVLS